MLYGMGDWVSEKRRRKYEHHWDTVAQGVKQVGTARATLNFLFECMKNAVRRLLAGPTPFFRVVWYPFGVCEASDRSKRE